MDLFKELIPSLTTVKKYAFTDESAEKTYNPFIINKALSQHVDMILAVNEMNRYYNLPKKMQYDFYFSAVKAHKRPFSPWGKVEKDEDIAAVSQFYGYSRQKAKEVVSLLTTEQLEKIHKKLEIGGK